MISSGIYSLLSSTSAMAVTEVFLWLMCSIFCVALVLRLFNYLKLFVDNAPSLLASLGILGTFIGIIIGLLHFDIQQLDTSISALLEGLKTAFITSVCGIALSLLLKAVTQYFRYPFDAKEKAIKPVDIIEALQAIEQAVALSREDQSRFSDNVGRALVAELKEVVAEFNSRIEQGFGDSIASFGESVAGFSQSFERVEQKIDGFVGHFDTLEKSAAAMVNSSNENARDMVEVGTKLNSLNDHFGSYLGRMENVLALLQKTNMQFSELNEKLLDYSARSLEVVNSVPEMNAKVEAFNNNIEELTQVTSERVKASLITLSEQSAGLSQHITGVVSAFKSASEIDSDILQGFIEESVSAYHLSVKEISDRQMQIHQGLISSVSEVIQTNLSRVGLSADNQQRKIEQHLEHELDVVMSSMGQALAAISGQFTRDYQQLIAQMQRILDRAEEVA